VATPTPHEASLVHRHCFPGDRRAGFYTLLASCGGAFGTSPAFAALVRERPTDPLLRYLAILQYPYYRPLQVRIGLELGTGALTDAPFFQALGSFRDRWLRWASLNPAAFREDGLKAEARRGLAFVRRHAGTPFGWAMLSVMADRPLVNGAAFWGEMADAYSRFADHPALGYAARYERARALLAAGRRAEARRLYEEMFDRARQANILPAVDTTFRDALRGGGAEEDRWSGLMRETAAALVRERRRPAVVSLAWQCEQLGDAPLAANLLDTALNGAGAEERPAVVLAAVAYLSQTDHVAAADELLTSLLKEETWSRVARLWRLASDLAEKRGQTARSIACLEQALALEYEDLPEVIDLEGVRRDYGRLLEHYQSLARTIATLGWEAPRDLVPRTIRAADRWRALDREGDAPCPSAATTLRLLGAPDLAWEYLTTPLGQRPNEVGPWRNLAQSLAREGQTALADQAYAAAFEAEPTNADVLWERAQNLRRAGREAEARPLLRQLAEGDWEPRFAGVRAQARWQLEGR
jgi:tetratricopeptide (TPR) repeat protein